MIPEPLCAFTWELLAKALVLTFGIMVFCAGFVYVAFKITIKSVSKR